MLFFILSRVCDYIKNPSTHNNRHHFPKELTPDQPAAARFCSSTDVAMSRWFQRSPAA